MPDVFTPRVCVVMPRGSSMVHRGAYRAYLTAVDNTNLDCDEQVCYRAAEVESCTSANNMQELWAAALNFRDEGLCTHLAMIHTDVLPGRPRGWVNALWNEMRLKGLGLVSSVVAIKERHTGRTSTGVGSVADPYRGAKRYVKVFDRYRLPQTFTTADVARDPDDVLLVNNGLMLLDLRLPALEDFDFVCPSEVRKDPATGRWRHRFRPEDWELSRRLHAAGVPYGATWVLPVRHAGEYDYPNDLEP